MNLVFVLPVAMALAMDAFAVSVGVSIGREGLSRHQSFRLAASFGFFQFLMPILGWMAGQTVTEMIKAVDHWVAFGLLLVVAVKMIYESLRDQEKSAKQGGDPTKGVVLIVLSLATSIDAFAVGLSIAALDKPVLFPSVIIGAVAYSMTAVGTKIGPVVGRKVGRRAEMLGGIILILIGAKILLDHLG